MTGRGNVFASALKLFFSIWAEHKAVQSVTFTDPWSGPMLVCHPLIRLTLNTQSWVNLEPYRCWQVTFRGYVRLLWELISEHLQCSFQLAAIRPTDVNKNGAAAFEGLFKILCDSLFFNVDTPCCWTNKKMLQSSLCFKHKKGKKS